ncbi:MAG: undecaprenyl-diphosphate phosphatase [Elusimicrobiota bacterium]
MISPFQALVYGLLQGLTEFLPVSSSAHLSLLPWLAGWPDPGLAFDVALHAGTLAALLAYFRADWARMLRAALREPRSEEARRLWVLALASVPAGLAGLLLEKQAETVFRTPALVAATLALFGLLLAWADRFAKDGGNAGDPSPSRALLIGAAQALAIVPGVSRSGATITAGLFLGLDREAAARFSFLLATPITAAAALHKVPKLGAGLLDPGVLLAVAASALSGAAAIHFLLRWTRRAGYLPFAAYRILLAAAIFASACRA